MECEITMKTRIKMAFAGYLVVALAFAVLGVWYLLSTQIMPYHLAAMGSSWENLSPGMQNMSLNFMKSAAAGFLTTSIAMLFLLFIPFRKGEAWSSWALLTISMNEFLIIISRMIDVTINTSGKPFLTPFIIIGIIAVISFLLSSGMDKKNKERAS